MRPASAREAVVGECVCPVCGFPSPVFTDGDAFFGFHYGLIGRSGGVRFDRPCPGTWLPVEWSGVAS